MLCSGPVIQPPRQPGGKQVAASSRGKLQQQQQQQETGTRTAGTHSGWNTRKCNKLPPPEGCRAQGNRAMAKGSDFFCNCETKVKSPKVCNARTRL